MPHSNSAFTNQVALRSSCSSTTGTHVTCLPDQDVSQDDVRSTSWQCRSQTGHESGQDRQQCVCDFMAEVSAKCEMCKENVAHMQYASSPLTPLHIVAGCEAAVRSGGGVGEAGGAAQAAPGRPPPQDQGRRGSHQGQSCQSHASPTSCARSAQWVRTRCQQSLSVPSCAC